MTSLLLATRNRGKAREIGKILALHDVELLDLRALGFEGEIEERGDTFEENALIKAREVFQQFGKPVIADDSGLVVPYLNGEPGVRSARYAGPLSNDEQNNCLLLKRLLGAVGEERRAFFCCVAVFYFGPDKYRVAEGTVYGSIMHELRGTEGFGYDPLFLVPEYGMAMAELSDEEKNAISHRGKAFTGLKRYIEEYFAGHDVEE